MPRARRSKAGRVRKSRKRSFKRKGRKHRWTRNPNSYGGPGGAGFPAVKTVRLRYCDVFTFSGATGSNNNYSANDCYDPDITGAGHQPRGFDQWSQFYKRYAVIGSNIRITVTQQTPTLVSQGIAFYVKTISYDDISLAAGTSLNSLIEEGNTTYRLAKMLGGDMNGPSKLSRRYSARKFWGFKDFKDNMFQVGFLVDQALPTTRNAVFQFGWRPLGTPVGSTYDAVVIIDYLVRFFEPAMIPISAQ